MGKLSNLTVVVLFGGTSSEHDISLRSASNVLPALVGLSCSVVCVGITRDGAWLRYRGALADVAADAWETHDVTPVVLVPGRHGGIVEQVGETFVPIRADVVLPVLHGQGGEDGTLQGALETCGIPYVGCGVLASAVGMDKDVAHRLANDAGVRVPGAATLRRNEDGSYDADAAAEAVESLGGYPVFVKPARGGSSIGVAKVTREEDLPAALSAAFALDEKVSLEEAIDGIEVGCAMMGPASAPAMGEVDEIVLADGGFFHIHQEAHPGAGQENATVRVPAQLPSEVMERVREVGEQVWRALGCEGVARVDLFVTPAGEVVFNEVNTMPGLTAYSRFPAMMAASGHSLDEVLGQLVSSAAARGRR